MLVTLITHPGDRALAVNLCARIQQLGGVQNHECLIVRPQGTNMDDIENVLKRCFQSVYVHQYAETLKGWPAGPNEAAAHAMLHCWTNNALRYHYLILEPDCVPMTERWLDIIDVSYRQSGNGAHVMGAKTDHWNMQGQVIGKHTVGVAVYPKLWPEICSPIKTMIEMSFGYVQQEQTPPPWDVYCGPYTNRCTAETPLIQHLTLQPTSEGGQFHWDCTLESALAQVNPKAVLVHGCKHPEFLHKVTGTNPVQIHAPETRKEISPVQHQGNAPREIVRQSPQPTREESGRQNGSGGGDQRQQEVTPAEAKRRKEIHEMRWPRLKSYAAKLGLKVHRVSRPDIEATVLEAEREQRIEKWSQSLPEPQVVTLPVEEMAPPIIPPPISSTSMTAVPWNSADVSTAEPGGAYSPTMQKQIRELQERRRAAGIA